jgi:hypothetical protein
MVLLRSQVACADSAADLADSAADHATDHAADLAADHAADLADSAADHAADLAADHAADHAADLAADHAADHAADNSLAVVSPLANFSAQSIAASERGSAFSDWQERAQKTANSRKSRSLKTPGLDAIQIIQSFRAVFHASSIVGQLATAQS